LRIAGEDDATGRTAGVHLTVRAASSGDLAEEAEDVGTPVSAVQAGRQQ
jgi:hypothetical protein